MKCRFCGVELAPLRAVSEGQFCSARHRKGYEQSQAAELSPELVTALIPLDWWTLEPVAPISAAVADPQEPAALYSERPQLLNRRHKVAFPTSMPVADRLFSLPAIAVSACVEPKAIEPLAVATDFGREPKLPPGITPATRPAQDAPVPVLDRLFALPFLAPVVAGEATPLVPIAVWCEIAGKPLLPSLGIVPATRPVQEETAIAALDRLLALPVLSPVVAEEFTPAEPLAVAFEIATPHLPVLRIAPAPLTATEPTVLHDRLFPLPFLSAVVVEEPKLIADYADGVEIIKRPHLLSWGAFPIVVPLAELIPARPEIIQAPAAVAATPEAPAFAEAQMVEPAPAGKPPSASSMEETLRGLAEPLRAVAWWARIPKMWGGLPVHVRALAMVAPIALILAFSRSLPSMPGTSGSNSLPIQKVLAQSLGSFRQQLASRAAIDLTDDFRTGLDDWQGRDNTTAEWSYDAAGFVRPAKLALYRPTLPLQDYRFEFLGEIDEKAMGCVFRATDPDNYYAVKFAISKPGPMPQIKLVRYAVVNGHEESHEERPLPFLSSADTLYRVLIDVHGSDFTIMSQGKMVDFWSDNRLKTGGVGLFCGRGEKARVRWVEVSHQYDTLGKLCAYLAPYSGQGRSGSLN